MDMDNSVVKAKGRGDEGRWRWAKGEVGEVCKNINIKSF